MIVINLSWALVALICLILCVTISAIGWFANELEDRMSILQKSKREKYEGLLIVLGVTTLVSFVMWGRVLALPISLYALGAYIHIEQFGRKV